MKFRLQNLPGIKELIRELEIGLRKLRPKDNFDGFETTVTIAAGIEATITNQLKTQLTRYIIMDQTAGNNVITRGDTPWTSSRVYIKNNGATSATVTIQFIR
jgi:hypothetical protein